MPRRRESRLLRREQPGVVPRQDPFIGHDLDRRGLRFVVGPSGGRHLRTGRAEPLVFRVERSRDPVESLAGLQKAGVPIFAVNQDASRYFDYHHSADDTLDIVDRSQLQQNVAAWAALLYWVADGTVDFRAKPAH